MKADATWSPPWSQPAELWGLATKLPSWGMMWDLSVLVVVCFIFVVGGTGENPGKSKRGRETQMLQFGLMLQMTRGRKILNISLACQYLIICFPSQLTYSIPNWSILPQTFVGISPKPLRQSKFQSDILSQSCHQAFLLFCFQEFSVDTTGTGED